MSEWQPIETAPKDGTTIQLWSPGNRWPDAGNWVAYEPDEQEETGEPGFWQYAESLIGDTGEIIENPSHWQPIIPPA
jgi:hypothetical protein